MRARTGTFDGSASLRLLLLAGTAALACGTADDERPPLNGNVAFEPGISARGPDRDPGRGATGGALGGGAGNGGNGGVAAFGGGGVGTGPDEVPGIGGTDVGVGGTGVGVGGTGVGVGGTGVGGTGVGGSGGADPDIPTTPDEAVAGFAGTF